jgi:hypothetical protein
VNIGKWIIENLEIGAREKTHLRGPRHTVLGREENKSKRASVNIMADEFRRISIVQK